MRQLQHDVRIVYVDNTDDTIQNCYNHQFQLENPNTYASRSLNLIGDRFYEINDANYVYISSQHPVRIMINGSNEVIAEHLSYINTTGAFDVHLSNSDVTILENNVQILYGRVEALTP